jgi:3-phosphoshikimate 1-carboxyvinyltransferase
MISGTLRIPGSKSHTHRAYVLAARSDEPVTVASPLRAADPDATLAALHALGARARIGDGVVEFQPSELRPSTAPVDLKNAGTGLRLLLAQAATLPFDTLFVGDASLSSRPNDDLLNVLKAAGVQVTSRQGCLPIRVQGVMKSGSMELSGATSSQYTSALMLALPMLPGTSLISLMPPVRSRPYLDITATLAEHFGLDINMSENRISIAGSQTPRCPMYEVPGDWSTAAFPMAAAAVTGGDIRIKGLDSGDPQGDKRIAELLRAFGATVDVNEHVRVRGTDLTSPGTIDVSATPDLFPILAVVAAHAKGTTNFTGGASLRHKETDRLAAVAAGLTAMGIQVTEQPEGMTVQGGTLRGATVAGCDDHRIHMAFRIAALVATGETTVTDPESVAISYPNFHEDLRRLSGQDS